MISKRRDDKGRVLQQGEWQEPSGRYRYKYTDSLGKRKILYSWRLTEADKMPEGKRADLSLREKERKVQSLQMQGITGSNITVLELVERYLSLKTGVKMCIRDRCLSGGFMHKMYKISTQQGIFALKLLNPFVMQRETAMDNFAKAERIEFLLEQQGVPVLPALSLCGRKMPVSYTHLFMWTSS